MLFYHKLLSKHGQNTTFGINTTFLWRTFGFVVSELCNQLVNNILKGGFRWNQLVNNILKGGFRWNQLVNNILKGGVQVEPACQQHP